MTVVEAVLLVVTAVGGIWWPAVYAGETPHWRAEAVGGDWVNLLLVAPLLLWSGARVERVAWRIAWLGVQGYVLYFFFIYTFAVHFNALFLVYCSVLGLSFYSVALAAPALRVEEAVAAFAGRVRERVAAGVLIGTAICFGLLWLAEVVPAIVKGETPAGVRTVGLPVNPVHVLDLSLFLPGFLLAGVWLWQKKPAGYLLGPALLTTAVVMSVSIVGMMLELRRVGLASSGGTSAVFAVVVVGEGWVLWDYLRGRRGGGGLR